MTPNPTLIVKAGQDYETQVKKICGIIGNVSAEVVSEKRDDILVEGCGLASWHKNVIVVEPPIDPIHRPALSKRLDRLAVSRP